MFFCFLFLAPLMLLSLFVSQTSSILFYWFSFFFLTLLFLFVAILDSVPNIILFNYTVLQEVSGLFFISFFSSEFSLIFLLLNSGVSPFHFWVSSIVGYLGEGSVVWFLVSQKFFYLPVLSVFSSSLTFVLWWGLVVLYLQILLVTSYTLLLMFSSLESFSWFLLMLESSFSSFLYYFFFYLLFISFSLNYLEGGYVDTLLVLILTGFPFFFGFFFKYFCFIFFFSFGSIIILIPVLLIFCSLLATSYFLICVVFTSYFTASLSLSFSFLSFFLILFIL